MFQPAHILCNALETAFNGLLQYDPDTRAALAELSGRSICVEIAGLDQAIHVLPVSEGLRFSRTGPESPDVIVRGYTTALLGMLRPDTNKGNRAGQVEIKGDIHLAQRLQTILRDMRIDWDEFMASYVGDTAAHKLGRFGRSLRIYVGESLSTLGMDISEYLRFEVRWLPARVEVEGFLQDVDRIRNDVERAQQRLTRLELRQGDDR